MTTVEHVKDPARVAAGKLGGIASGRARRTSGTAPNGSNGSPYKVESGIPIPARGQGTRRTLKYPFLTMKPGDSFFMAVRGGNGATSRAQALVSAHLAHYRKTVKDLRACAITTRQVPDGVRVWRVR